MQKCQLCGTGEKEAQATSHHGLDRLEEEGDSIDRPQDREHRVHLVQLADRSSLLPASAGEAAETVELLHIPAGWANNSRRHTVRADGLHPQRDEA